jgi:hypothetical protein
MSKILSLEAIKDKKDCTNALNCPKKMIPLSCETQGSCCGYFFGVEESNGKTFVRCSGGSK